MFNTDIAVAFSTAKAALAAKAAKARAAAAARYRKAWQDRLQSLDWDKVVRVNTASPRGYFASWIRAGMPMVSAVKEEKTMFNFDLQLFAAKKAADSDDIFFYRHRVQEIKRVHESASQVFVAAPAPEIADKTVTVKSRRQAERLVRKIAIGDRAKAFNALKVRCYGNMTFTLSVGQLDGTDLNKYIEIGPEAIQTIGGSPEVYKNFTRDLLQVAMADTSCGYAMDSQWFICEDDTLGLVVYRQDHGKDGKIYDREGQVVDFEAIRSSVVRSFNPDTTDLSVDEANKLSVSADQTAGDRKQLKLNMLAAQRPIQEIKFCLSNGLSEAFHLREAKQGDIAKGSVRRTQSMAPNVNFGNMDCVVWYMGKWNFADGLEDITAEWLADSLYNYTGHAYKFLPQSLYGLGLQARPASCKGMGKVQPRKTVLSHINRYADKDDFVVLVKGQVTDEQQLSLLLEYAGFENDFSGKHLVICANEEIAAHWQDHVSFYGDENAFKGSIDLNWQISCPVLDVTHGTHDIKHGAKSSTQLFQSFMVADWKKAMEFMAVAVRRDITEKRDALMSDEPIAPSMSDLGSSRVATRIMPTLARDIYFPLLKQEVNGAIGSLVSGAGNTSLRITGGYAKILPDEAMELAGTNILQVLEGGVCEVLCPAATAHGITRLLGVKYPKQHVREFLKAVVVTPDEYCRRVDGRKDLTEDQRTILKQAAKTLSEGYIVTPAYSIVMNMLAGMDYDGDGLSWFACNDDSSAAIYDKTKEYSVEELTELLKAYLAYFWEVMDPLAVVFPE